MDFQKRLNDQLQTALKVKDQITLKTVRDLKARVKSREIEKGDSLTEAEFIKVVQTAAKQRKESVELYEKGNRPELVDIELAELKVLETYLPQMMSEDEMQKLARGVVEKLNASSMADIGKVMGLLMQEAAGQADGKRLQVIVRELLGG